MALYIKGMGNISAQQTWDETSFLSDVKSSGNNRFFAVEPDYSTFIDVKQLRRMSRIIRMGVTSSMMALRQAGIAVPDAIITGTGYGCLEDTGIFLTKLIENKEQALPPTPFIQSTHNTIGSQVALLLQCQGYNQTYAHGAFSFESALIDALMHGQDNPSQNILVGGIDEITEYSHAIQSRFGIFKSTNGTPTNAETVTPVIANGEAASFFVVSADKGTNDLAFIEEVVTFYKPDVKQLKDGVTDFLNRHKIKFDFVLTGVSGNGQMDRQLNQVTTDLFQEYDKGNYKHLSGEYPVSTGFATWLAAKIIEGRQVPASVGQTSDGNPLKSILIFNQHFGTHYSLISVRAC
jgi:3-oxoacyl-[acyl-carrier-protein] synthase II